MENLNILLLGAGNRLSLCEWLIEAGKKYNKKVNLYSVEVKNPVPISQHATILKGEKWDSPNFEKSIIDIVKTYNIHMLLPLMDAGCTALSKYKENIEKETNTWAVVSSYNICNTMEDKGLSEKWFIKNKVNIPYDIKFPKIFKSIKGYGSNPLSANQTTFTVSQVKINAPNNTINFQLPPKEATLSGMTPVR